MAKAEYDSRFVTPPTNAERIHFLETLMRTQKAHEPACATFHPTIDFENWEYDGTEQAKNPPTITYPCDCWLVKPFGTVGMKPPA